jgi:hypothetical protein
MRKGEQVYAEVQPRPQQISRRLTCDRTLSSVVRVVALNSDTRMTRINMLFGHNSYSISVNAVAMCSHWRGKVFWPPLTEIMNLK